MYQIRHLCNARLFDSHFECEETHGEVADIAIVCQRCHRTSEKAPPRGLVKYRVKTIRWVPHIAPEPVYCSNLDCLERLCDLGIPYMLVDDKHRSDVDIKCRHCGEITIIHFSRVIDIT